MSPLRTLALLALALPTGAQVTHQVDVLGSPFIYDPDTLVIEVGDTVEWVWGFGIHNVESGVGGIADGNFTSGPPINSPGFTYSVTFDAAFLTANPMSGNAYPYYCAIHVSLGQTGTIIVDQTEPYGACNSTPGSLLHTAGSPDIGGAFEVSVHDPVGSVPVGSIALLIMSVFPDPGFPCGTPLPGFGMSGPAGDLLVNLFPPDPAGTFIGPAWGGAPAPIAVGIPNVPGIVGLTVYAQGALTGLGPSRLTEGMRISIGLP